MSISSTLHSRKVLPAGFPASEAGAFFVDAIAGTVVAITAQDESGGGSPFNLLDKNEPRTEVADIKDAENSSIEHSKTELQRFDELRPDIKVHAITDDFNLS